MRLPVEVVKEMKIDFSQVLIDFRTGEQLLRQSATADAKAEPLTLGFCCTEALLAPNENEKDPDKKTADLVLATLVFKGGEVEIKPEQALHLKKKIAAWYNSPLVVGQCCQMLDG